MSTDRFRAAKSAVTTLYALAHTAGQWAQNPTIDEHTIKRHSDDTFAYRDALVRVVSEAMDVASGADLDVSEHPDWREMVSRCKRLRDALEDARIWEHGDSGGAA